MFQPLNKTVFSVLAMFFIGTAAFVLLDTFRGYRAEITILALPLRTTQTPSEQMVENIAVLPTTVSFLDALLASDERLAEFSSLDEQSLNTRSEEWNKILSVRRQGGSGVITYAIEANTQEEAMLFARQMSKVLFQKVGIYYDIRSDMSLRLIEGPLVRASLISPVTWIILSLGVGMGIAISIMTISNLFRLMIGAPRRKLAPGKEISSPTLRPTETAYPAIHPDTFIPKKPTVFFSEESEARAREEKREYNPYLITPALKQTTALGDSVDASVSMEAAPVTIPQQTSPLPPKEFAENKTKTAPFQAPTLITKSEAPSNLPFIDEATFLAQFSSNATESPQAEQEKAPATEINTAIEPEIETPLPSEPTVEDYRRRLNELLKEGK
ncbi:MAG: hypothetical protein KBC19_04050 [Candidatus Moranbacteria bacterium]|jgi:capsular polysaccharide biosynthesis protein|nr:hypothetical protein [Candidatus Moranbacteria bacterium]